MKPLNLLVYFILLSSNAFATQTPKLSVNKTPAGAQIKIQIQGSDYLQTPAEGVWSIAQNVKNKKTIKWIHASPTRVSNNGPWTILDGSMPMDGGKWALQDACRHEGDRIKCIRRMHWQGNTKLKNVVLSIRWQVNAASATIFQPGLLYYGNPAAKKTDPSRIAHMSGIPGEFVRFEEHRFPMPFTSLEWPNNKRFYGAALHSIPSPVPNANLNDQWWSLGAEHFSEHTELQLLSGPIGYNKKTNVAKAYQKKSAPYVGTTMTVTPDLVIEKTYYLQAYPVAREGDGFRKPLHTSINIFKPFYSDEFPSYNDIVADKLRFLEQRWIAGKDYAGFNMFDHSFRKKIVMGWAGQSDAPGYALLALAQKHNRRDLLAKAQSAMDFLVTSPMDDDGFYVRYDIDSNTWSRKDPVSQGQALFMFANAIKLGRAIDAIDTSKWEQFFQQAADLYANRILAKGWYPVSTNEGFLIAPLSIGYELFGNEHYRKAALTAADHYGMRHLSMREPYWGGTLDARGEDKEGAWAAFQGFMAAYDLTQDKKYLDWAEHAGDAVLSYLVVWDIPLPAGRLADHAFKTRGWTFVSPQNQHLDVYGVLVTPWIYRLGEITGNENMKKIAALMYRSCGQLIDPYGSQGEQIQHTNFVQSHSNIAKAGKNPHPSRFRGGYSEDWTVLWITTHFLTAAALFEEMGVSL